MTPAQKAAETRKRNKVRDERATVVADAMSDERRRMNAALSAGAVVTVETAFGNYTLDMVTTDHWYVTHPEAQVRDRFNQRSWCGCNDGQWARMLAQAGEARAAAFADHAWAPAPGFVVTL